MDQSLKDVFFQDTDHSQVQQLTVLWQLTPENSYKWKATLDYMGRTFSKKQDKTKTQYWPGAGRISRIGEVTGRRALGWKEAGFHPAQQQTNSEKRQRLSLIFSIK